MALGSAAPSIRGRTFRLRGTPRLDLRSLVEGPVRSALPQAFAIAQPRPDRVGRLRVERDDALLAALAEHAHDAAPTDSRHRDRARRARSTAGPTRRTARGSPCRAGRARTTCPARRAASTSRPAPDDSGCGLLALRRTDERGRISFEHAFAPQVAAEGADRRQLTRRRGLRVAALVPDRRGTRGAFR